MVNQLKSVALTVRDLERSISFYTTTLQFSLQGIASISGEEVGLLFGFGKTSATIRLATLTMGEEKIELLAFDNSTRGREIPFDSQSNDKWFQHIAIVVSDMNEAYQILRRNRVAHISTAPQTLPDWNLAAGGIKAFYFRDPDGHPLELIWFPKGKGSAKWQENSSLFQGIDHTAIGVADTEKSRAFYETLLGFRVSGVSENYGLEQERLNQVFGARLLITGLNTGLKSSGGFGLEFLEYLAPPNGRPYPPDSKPNDLWHWHTTLEVESLQSTFEALKSAGVTFISEGVVALNHQQAALARDPDGHAILFTQTS